MLGSECPGWVCYLEKVLGTKFIKFASRVKPPQLVAAAIVRSVFARMDPPVDPSKMFIGLIAPCFDKKLEAAREEVRREYPVIDLVLASNEINEFMSKEISDFNFYYKQKVADKSFVVDFGPVLLNENLTCLSSAMPSCNEFTLRFDQFQLRRGFETRGDSNGYLTFIISQIENVDSVKYRTLKNQNFTEVKVILKSSETLLFAYVYGFKNIQNLIRRIKMKKCKYRYVEVMACPSGCINGGGQLMLKKAELQELSEQSLNSKEQYDFKMELQKLEKLIGLETSGDLTAHSLGWYHIEPIGEKDPLKIKW